MGFWRRVGDWLTVADARQQFSSDGPPQPQPIDRVIAAIMGSNLVPTVGKNEALSVPAVLRGRNLIATPATLPLVMTGPDRVTTRSPLLEQIDPNVPNVVTLAQTFEDLLFHAVSYWRVTARGFDGFPYSAEHVDFSSVSVVRPYGSSRNPAPLPDGTDPRHAVPYIDGEPSSWRDVIRFSSTNPALLVSGGRAIRRALLLDLAAELYAKNPAPLDYFTPADVTDPADDDAIIAMLDDFAQARRTRSTGYIPAAVKYNTVAITTPRDLQLVELQQRAALDIANALGIDAEDLGISTTSRTYQNGVDRRQDRINDVLSPYMAAITDRLSMGDITKRGYSVRFDLDRYLRADPLTRAQVYAAGIRDGWLTKDEARAEEYLPDLTPEQELRMLPPTPAPQPSGLPVTATSDFSVTFDGEGSADFAVEFSAVDLEARTITGLVVPYNRVALKGGRKFRFLPGSLQFADLSRVKLLRDHVNSSALGKAISTSDGPDGVVMTFKVSRGPEGDQALALADDGVLDGLSVGVDIAESGPDPQNPGVIAVALARLKEVSLTAMPAFDDARLMTVTASADQGDIVPDIEPTPTAPATVPAIDYTALAAAIAAHTPAPAAQFHADGPTLVDPSRHIAQTSVNEGPLYRFDGGKGQRNFTDDVAHDFDGDKGLKNRAAQFIADQMRVAFANISTSNVAGLNPTINRPELYVPNLYFARPIGNMVTGGVVDEITTQRLPKFASSSGLAATHSQGVEPTDGAFTATTQDVTPAPISGRVTINREVIDQGGTPQTDQLIWGEMTQFYAKLLETRLVDALQALSLSDTPIVGVDADLQAALLAEFAGLQFIAGGDRYRGLALNSDLYTATIGAVDADGRALFPMLNPTNAQGTTASDFSAVRVGSKVGVPAWALASGNGGPDKSFLFVPESVYQWFSPPRRIDLNQVAVATVAIGIWGYSAEFVSRNSDVIQLAYTAS